MRVQGPNLVARSRVDRQRLSDTRGGVVTHIGAAARVGGRADDTQGEEVPSAETERARETAADAHVHHRRTEKGHGNPIEACEDARPRLEAAATQISDGHLRHIFSNVVDRPTDGAAKADTEADAVLSSIPVVEYGEAGKASPPNSR